MLLLSGQSRDGGQGLLRRCLCAQWRLACPSPRCTLDAARLAPAQGEEKAVVARHEVGHALVSTAVAAVLPGGPSGLVEKLSIIPRSGGALGFTYIPPKTEDRWG
jgi:hypothetical protein